MKIRLSVVPLLIVVPTLLAAQLRPATSGDSRVLENAFRQNSAVLLPGARTNLDEIASAIRAAPNTAWEIGGYTSTVGTASRNLQVSRQRADAVRAYLVSQGVPAASLTAVGYGSAHPVASNSTAAGRAHNMRVEIKRLPSPIPDTATRQASVAAPPPDRPVAVKPAAAVIVTPVPAPVPAAAPTPARATAPRPAGQEGGAFGFGADWASYSTSYWFYGGGNSRWQAWGQVQASGFFEGRAPLRFGALQTRYRIELRVGTGGANSAVGAGYVGNGASLTNGSLSGGLAATLRLPLSAGTGMQPRPFVGLGVDYSVLWGFGDNSATMYGKGWNERLLTVPLVVGVNLYTAHLTFRPEIRYAFLGWSNSNLYLSGAGYAMQNTTPTMRGIFVSMNWR